MAWRQPVMKKWRGMTSSCRRCLREEERGGGDRQRGWQSYEPLLYSSLLMTPTAPFLPKAGIIIKPKSHLLTWSSILPKVYSHTQAELWAHEEWQRGSASVSGGHRTNRAWPQFMKKSWNFFYVNFSFFFFFSQDIKHDRLLILKVPCCLHILYFF